MSEIFTVVDQDEVHQLDVIVRDGQVLMSQGDLERALGWALKPEGFCRDDVCVPVRDPSVVTTEGIDLQGFASLLGRPLALDIGEGAAALGAAADERSMALRSLEAPGFALPDLSGQMHSLSDFRGQKIFLAVWASW